MQSQMDYIANTCLTSMISCLFSKHAHMPKYEDVYGFLYDAKQLSDIEAKKEEAKKQAEIKKAQIGLLNLANSFNAKFSKKDENKTDDM